jgi:hypothetical protein
MEPDIEYDYLVQVMDAVRVREKKPKGEIVEENQDRETESEKIVLFPDISIGDAP